jgi:hypothetical protein
MPSSFTTLSIMNTALTQFGLDEIVSMEDGTAEFTLMSRAWPMIVEGELERGRYHFAKEEAELLSRVPGKFGFHDGYLVPNEALHVRRVWTADQADSTQVAWVQDQSAVYLNAPDGIMAELIIAPETHVFSALFCEGVAHRLRAALYRAVEDNAGAREAEGMARIAFDDARANASRSRQSTDAFRLGTIATARFGGRG